MPLLLFALLTSTRSFLLLLAMPFVTSSFVLLPRMALLLVASYYK